MNDYEENEVTKAKLNTLVPGWREMSERRIICELLERVRVSGVKHSLTTCNPIAKIASTPRGTGG